MLADTLIQVGRTLKAHGVKGELKVLIEDTYLEDFLKVSVCFLKSEGAFLPFFIENIRMPALIVSLEDIKAREECLSLVSKEIYLKSEDISKSSKDLASNKVKHELIGFTIIDSHLGTIGKIKSIQSNAYQDIALLDHNDGEVMIPLVEDFILDFDEEKKEIVMELPEGLLDL